MVELGVVEDRQHRAAGAGLGVGGGVDEAADARVQDGSCAHRAGLKGGVEIAVFEAIVPQGNSCGAYSYDLGVGGRIGVGDNAVAAGGDDLAVAYDDRADGDFAGEFGLAGFGYGELEEVEVGLHTFGKCIVQ